jgi:hypothetical protein
MTKSSPLVRALFGLWWIAAPLLLIAAILFFGRADFIPTHVAEPVAAPQLWPAPEFMVVEIPILQDTGFGARDAILIVSQPELQRAVVNADGVALVKLPKAERIVFLAYAPGFSLYQGDLAVDENDQVEAIHLQPLHRPDFSGGTPLVKLTRTVHLSDEQGEPLSALLVLAREIGNPDSEPWVAISDAQGVASFEDATAADLHLDIYPAGFPPQLATRIGAIDVPADQQETPLRLPTARLEISGLPPDSLFEWKRLDQAQLLPLHRVTATGMLYLGPVPLGSYRLEVGSFRHDIELGVGLTRIDFRQLSAATQ